MKEKDFTKYFLVTGKNSKKNISKLIIKLDVKKWKFTSLDKNENLEGIEIYQNPKNTYCIEGDYSLVEIDEGEAKEKILNQKEEKKKWEKYKNTF